MSENKPKYRHLRLGLWVLVAAWCGVSCGNRPPPVRTYTQISEQPRAMGMGHQHGGAATMPAATASRALGWDTPAEWTEEPGSGMRLASFSAGETDDAARITLTALSGSAGGLEANVKRWLNQLGRPPESEEAFQEFLASQSTVRTQGGQTATLVDFTGLADDDAADSMIAAVIPLEGKTIFAKMTGPAARLRAEQARLQALCESIRMEP